MNDHGSINITLSTEPRLLARMGRMLTEMSKVFSDPVTTRTGRFPSQPEIQDPNHKPVPEGSLLNMDYSAVEQRVAESLSDDDPAGIDFAAVQEAAAEALDVPPPPADTPLPPAPDGPPAPAIELDRDGRPWDARIDSSSHAMNKDGTWRLKRGVDQKFVEQVKAEHRAAAAPSVPAAPAAPAPAPAPVNPVDAAAPDLLVAPPLPAAPPPAPVPAPAPAAPVAPPPPVTQAASDVVTWPMLQQKITRSGGSITIDMVNAACAKHGIAKFPILANYPDKVILVHNELFPVQPAQPAQGV